MELGTLFSLALCTLYGLLHSTCSRLWFSVYVFAPFLEDRNHVLFVFVSSMLSDIWHPGGV